MAIERGMCGFEIGTFDEFDLVSAGASLHNDVNNARTGTWFLRLAPSASQSQTRYLSDSTVLNGGAGGNFRAHFRFFMRVNSLPVSGSARFAYLETVAEAYIDNTGAVTVDIVGHGGVSVGSISAGSTWHQIDLEWSIDNNSPATATWKCTIDNGASGTATQVFAGPFGVGEFSFGDNNNRTFSIDYDDLVYEAHSGADNTGAITLPIATHVLPMPITGQGSINNWTGTYADVQDVPPQTIPDTFQSSATPTAETRWKVASIGFMDTSSGNRQDWVKLYAWTRHSGSGTKDVKYKIAGNVTAEFTTLPGLPAGYPTGLQIRGGLDTTTRTLTAFDAIDYGVQEIGTCQANCGSAFVEVLIRVVVPIVLSITPTTGTWKGGTAFKVTGLYFQPATIIYFQQIAGAMPAGNMQFIDAQNMAGTTPADVSGAETVQVTAL